MKVQNTNTEKIPTRIVYEGWLDYILSCEQEIGPEYAAKLTKAILCAIFGRNYKTDSKMINSYIEGTVLPLSIAAQKRYIGSKENGKKGGAPSLLDENDNLEIAQMRKQKITQKAIAQHFGVSEDTIRRSEGWSNWKELIESQQNLAEPSKTNSDVLPDLQENYRKPGKTPQAPQNLYVYDYVYDNNYVNDYDDNNSFCSLIIQRDNIVNSKTGEVLAKVNEANYEREDYWDNVTNPVFELQEDPTLAAALTKYPNYLTLPMLNADNSFPDKSGWAFPPSGAAREQQHLDAAALGYRLCKLEK